MPPTWPAERAQFERKTAFLHVGQRSDDHRTDDRERGHAVGRGRCPRCRGRAHAGSRRWSRLVRRGSGPPRSWRLPRRRTAATPRDAPGPRTSARGSVVRTNRPIEVEMASKRTRVWAANSTPSSVASNGPTRTSTVVPARVKTLTRITEMTMGSDSSTDARTSRTRTPATCARDRVMAMSASGPGSHRARRPRPTPTVAMTSLVSGLRR